MQQTSSANGIFGILAAFGLVATMLLFLYAAMQGEFGLVRLFQVQAQENLLIEELDELILAREKLENRTMRLSNGYLDLDLLDEQTRKVLGMARGDEIIIQ